MWVGLQNLESAPVEMVAERFGVPMESTGRRSESDVSATDTHQRALVIHEGEESWRMNRNKSCNLVRTKPIR